MVELRRINDNVEGDITPEGATRAQHFSSWLELLWVLEPAGDTEANGNLNAILPPSVLEAALSK
jgi:hypothetical protein